MFFPIIDEIQTYPSLQLSMQNSPFAIVIPILFSCSGGLQISVAGPLLYGDYYLTLLEHLDNKKQSHLLEFDANSCTLQGNFHG